MGKRILVITGGEPVGERADLDAVMPYDLVIAADCGLERAIALGIQPTIVVGDLDSASRHAVAMARQNGSEIDALAPEKEHTDFEIALKRAIEEDASEIAVIGGGAGRPDHWLANLSLIAAIARGGITVSAQMNGWLIWGIGPGVPYADSLRAGELLSLLPIGGDAEGVTTEGLAYPLNHEDLLWTASRGVSNVALGGPVRVEVEAGSLLVMRPKNTVAESELGEESR